MDTRVTTVGLPPTIADYFAGQLIASPSTVSWILRIKPNRFNGETWENYHAGSTWLGWFSYATATPSQEFDLPLEAGITANSPGSHFEKTQDGRVRFTIRLVRSDGGNFTVEAEHVATFPEGYRPKEYIYCPCYFSDGAYWCGIGALEVYPSGAVQVWQVPNVPRPIKYIYCKDYFAI